MARKREAHRRVSASPWVGARWTPQAAQRVLEAWRRSGLNLAAWCRREGVEYERVRRWRRQLTAQSRRSLTPRAFLPVRVVEGTAPPQSARFEIELAGGRRLHVPAQFDATELSRLLGVLEASA